ncbi:CHAT domain-containing protein [Suillus bovinus]|uniref:CHAT domain-containing protein n=1 Tax=Suillus bovinus TaxID=48563 RepID=UPI001B868443|nr:CHAT domain-containing protein [Suillus bovinus]KAG2151665.1 CHAT domain-containing protein [Suillus bovinus]
MAHRRPGTFESSSSSESDSDSASSSSTPVQKSIRSTELLKGRKHKRKSSGNDNDDETKNSKRPRSPKKDAEPSHLEHTENLGEMHLSEVQQVVITAIHATDLTIGLRRIPAGFHMVVKADGAEYQTSDKSAHVDQAVVEWHECILLPREPSSKVRVSVYATFELGPRLCHGDLLRTFEISVGELLDRSEKSHRIIFQPKQGEVVSACTSLFMTVDQRLSNQNDAGVLCRLTTLTSRDMDTLALKTDAGHRLLARYRRTQNRSDLDQSIKHFERASDLCPMHHFYRPAALFNLATAKFISCQANGRYLDDIPIHLFQDALDLRPTGHADRPITQLHLAIALLFRFAKRGFQTDADAAKKLLSEVLDVCHANSHIYRAAFIALETSAIHSAGNNNTNELGQERSTASMYPLSPYQLARRAQRCLHRDQPRDLDEVISLHYDALVYYNAGHASRGQLLGNLAVMLQTRFERRGEDKDLDQAIAFETEMLALRPVGHPGRFIALNNLATQLSTRFEHRGNNEDLDGATALNREALALCPVGHTYRSKALHNLASHLSSRFEHRGNDEDLDGGITLYRQALALCPIGHPDRSMSLNNLAIQLSSRFKHRGNDEDLDEADALHREALALRPVGHPDRFMSLNNFAAQLSTRFDHRGHDKDLDEAIALHREALVLCPVGHPDRVMSLINLANQLSDRFEHRGNNEDLDEATALDREALILLPVGHPDRSKSLNNFANRLSSRFEHRGNDEDLDQAIAFRREALALHPVGHIGLSMSLYNLATQLSSRFRHRGNGEDLDQAITLHREALALRPVGHTNRPSSLINLANQLGTRFAHQRNGNKEDLEEARENFHCALALLTQHDPRRSAVHASLADVYLSFYFFSGLDDTGTVEYTESLETAMHHLKAAASVVSAGLLSRLRASLRWVRCADQHGHGTQLEAYTTFMQLLDAYMSTTASVSSRHKIMKDFPSTLALDAASCALRSGDVCRAVELLEQGRTIIWTQMTRLRTHLDNLQTHGDHAVALMKRFRDLSSLLDKPPANRAEATSRVAIEAEETRYRRLVEDWNGTVEEIRKIEGFSRFLLPPLFSDLPDAARDGPIIMLIASESSCNAIIITHKQPPTSIQLATNLQKLIKLVLDFQEAVEKEAGPKGNQTALIKALRELWDVVVCPVVENLNGFARRGSRIWWCPTSLFNFLPLHAAGEYRAQGKSLSQQYISSYTPSLTALIKARRSHHRSPSVPFVAVGQDFPAGASFILDAVEPELELVRRLLPPPPTVSFSKVTSVDATKSRALRALRDNTWIHLACHGTQRFDEPFKSAFLMRDQPLSLLDIAQMNLSRHEFAFLSACQTAVGAFSTPDEVIHLAAGLQFAGVNSVVGTLWKVTDSTVHRLVEAFYNKLCGDGPMNSKRAAWALHQAVQSLASDKENTMTLDQRIVFVHIGI